jgi:hypothetical protein
MKQTESAIAGWLRRLVRCLDLLFAKEECEALLRQLNLQRGDLLGYVVSHLLVSHLKVRNHLEILLYRLKILKGLFKLFAFRCRHRGLRVECRVLLWCVFHKMSYYKKIVAETPNDPKLSHADRRVTPQAR